MKTPTPAVSTSSNQLLIAVLACASFAGTTPVEAQWTRWAGPAGDFVASTKSVATTNPPQILWRRSLGDGHSAILVDDGLLYTMYEKDGRERVVALDAATGSPKWEHDYASSLRPSYPQYRGPHATPLIVGSRLFSIGIEARLTALDKRSGQLLWEHDLVKAFGTKLPQSGYAASPLAYKDTVLLPVGGTNGRGFGAFSQQDGRVKWLRHDFKMSHASPIMIELHGRPQVVMNLVDEMAGLDPKDGALLWRQSLPQTMDNVSFTPLWDANARRIYTSHYYDWAEGTRAIQLDSQNGQTRARVAWHGSRPAVEITNAVVIDGVLYGSHGNNAFSLVAMDTSDGSQLWRQRHPRCNLLVAGKQLVILDESGRLSIVQPHSTGVTELTSRQILGEGAWTVPTLVGSTLYARDAQHVAAVTLN